MGQCQQRELELSFLIFDIACVVRTLYFPNSLRISRLNKTNMGYSWSGSIYIIHEDTKAVKTNLNLTIDEDIFVNQFICVDVKQFIGLHRYIR